MSDGDDTTNVVAAGYDAVYEAWPRAATLMRIWREQVLGADFPAGYEHISFLSLAELASMRDALALAAESELVDLACGAGGPGLWVARETGARLTGIDVSPVGVTRALERAAAVGMGERARFAVGTFAATGLAGGSMDAAMSADALQYAPDKAAAMREVVRVLRPGGRLAFTAFELDASRVAGLPVLGTDATEDYGPSLAAAGLTVRSYEETPRWRERLTSAYGAIAASRETLAAEMGEAAAGALLGEITLTLQVMPYRRRVMVVAERGTEQPRT